MIFALGSSRHFGEAVCQHLGLSLASHEEREFTGGEHKARPLDDVLGHDVYVIHSLFGEAEQSANDKLCRLLFFVGAVKDAGAGSVTAIVPYLAYARKDRRTKTRDPVTTRYVACLFEAVGTDRVVTMDVHNLAAFENAFRIPKEHLEARPLFADHFAALARDQDVVVVSPDVGGVKRAELFRMSLQNRVGRRIPVAFMEKRRSAGVVSGDTLVGSVSDQTAIIIDDQISSGTTIVRAAGACHEAGARAIYVAAAHGVFTQEAATLPLEAVEQVLITDTVSVDIAPGPLQDKLRVISATGRFAEAIRRLDVGESLADLLELE